MCCNNIANDDNDDDKQRNNNDNDNDNIRKPNSELIF